MSHTNSTPNYNLPQFLTTDKPAWLTDINGAFSDIDTAVNNAQSKADTAYNNAGTAQGDATTALTNAATADAKASGAIASIETAFDPTTIYPVGAKVMYNSLLYRCVAAVVTPGPWTGSDNWERITVDNLIAATNNNIGSLTSLSTTDKTSIVNAVNEVNGSKADPNPSSVAINAITNVSSILNGGSYKLGKLVHCCTDFRLSVSVNSGDRILSVGLSANYPPDQSYCCAIRGSNGTVFKVVVYPDGAIRASSAMGADEYVLLGYWRTTS